MKNLSKKIEKLKNIEKTDQFIIEINNSLNQYLFMYINKYSLKISDKKLKNEFNFITERDDKL